MEEAVERVLETHGTKETVEVCLEKLTYNIRTLIGFCQPDSKLATHWGIVLHHVLQPVQMGLASCGLVHPMVQSAENWKELDNSSKQTYAERMIQVVRTLTPKKLKGFLKIPSVRSTLFSASSTEIQKKKKTAKTRKQCSNPSRFTHEEISDIRQYILDDWLVLADCLMVEEVTSLDTSHLRSTFGVEAMKKNVLEWFPPVQRGKAGTLQLNGSKRKDSSSPSPPSSSSLSNSLPPLEENKQSGSSKKRKVKEPSGVKKPKKRTKKAVSGSPPLSSSLEVDNGKNPLEDAKNPNFIESYFPKEKWDTQHVSQTDSSLSSSSSSTSSTSVIVKALTRIQSTIQSVLTALSSSSSPPSPS